MSGIRKTLALAVIMTVQGLGGSFAQSECSAARVDIRGAEGNPGLRQSFSVEIADDPEERAQGLMLREALAADAGMLFIYDTPHAATFWMKNTLIPLDLLFADETGRITRVHPRAIPHDLTPIPGGEGVKFVLEINGGLAARAGITPGAVMRHPAIGEKALWPCG